jgi:hypothetical protein
MNRAPVKTKFNKTPKKFCIFFFPQTKHAESAKKQVEAYFIHKIARKNDAST